MQDERTNSLALMSLIAGALSWIVAPLIGSLAAVVAGHVALRQIRNWGGEGGAGVAYLGLALGYANLVGLGSLVLVALWLFGAFGGALTLAAVSGG